MLPQKIDHVEAAKSRLITFFRDKPVINGLFDSVFEGFNDVEDLLFDLLEKRSIYTAEGVQIDSIGEMFGVVRNGLSDEEYRSAILAKISEVNSDGTTEVFMNVMRINTNSNNVNFFEHFSGDVHAYLQEGYDKYTYRQLKRSVPAGVVLTVLVDYKGDSVVLGELIPIFSNLVDNQSRYFTTDGLDHVLVQTLSASDYNGKFYFTEIEVADTAYMPLAEILPEKVTVERGRLLYEDGDRILDEKGNFISYSA